MDVLRRLFEQHYRLPAEDARALQGQLGGSGRAIVRLTGGGSSAIGVVYSVREENLAFLQFSRHFRRHGLPVPEIYAEDLSEGAYLEEDLGDTTLFEFLGLHRAGEAIAPQARDAYRKVVAVLPRFQVEAGRDLNYKVCYPRDRFDRQSIAWDLNYFKYYFLRLAGVPFNEQDLEQDFSRLTKFLLCADHDYFLYRDFQSRNVMLRGGQPFFLDYQGGRKGALQYDIASLLYDGKADLPPEMRQELLDYYLDCLGSYISLRREAFMEHYYAYVYVRILQALGAYGFRGFYERKAHFLQSVPYALKNLRWLAEHAKLPIALPALMEALAGIAASEKLQGLASQAEGKQKTEQALYQCTTSQPAEKLNRAVGRGFIPGIRPMESTRALAPEACFSGISPENQPFSAASSAVPQTPQSTFGALAPDERLSDAARQILTVRIFSFSFHKQMPPDEAGNGGGFVFDARSLFNPGREERFRTMTGKDAAVIDYLNREAGVQQFLASVESLVDASVSQYQSRGFKNLMVSFGCTGGQHRSVYLAEQLARHLRDCGVEVVVRHIELEKMGR
jgi:aminoglycoside/choline kinase family phosphotransferase